MFSICYYVIKWDRALAMAPGISMDYWKELMER